eukprot:6188588-Pleurochrysis_carterae.AAC.3
MTELAHPGRSAVGVAEDDARTCVVAACPSAGSVRAPESEVALSTRPRHRHAAQAFAVLSTQPRCCASQRRSL